MGEKTEGKMNSFRCRDASQPEEDRQHQHRANITTTIITTTTASPPPPLTPHHHQQHHDEWCFKSAGFATATTTPLLSHRAT
jgi:hypothetical protein